MAKKFFTSTTQFIVLLSLFLYSFSSVSSFITLSTNEDCGSHYIELCSHHDDSHFVLSHHENDLMAGDVQEIPHDKSHQIEIDKSDYVLAKRTLTNDLFSKQILVNNNQLYVPVVYKFTAPYNSLSPPDNNLLAIKTIRLQI